ncbi:N-acetylglucosaminylphosphatidylinositol deacetylase [Malassezia cuniculi]|uniref:N-acetylglucosaminylphosphatidylinositol deacetylase n=1 Tax=Malassezia cuniculi TaxID=948313 RepID=A0AAF0ERW5_9BASI|nr:N-acetylglucosaminylphosphatidylinositol deacetylase [Malassezia cuniculi]
MNRKVNRLVRQLFLVGVVCTAIVLLTGGVHAPDGALGKKALVLTAHPDDEAMFFSPTVLSHPHVSALCLSTGNAEGLGGVRATELVASYAALGVPANRVAYVDDPALQDGMDTAWDPAHIARIVAARVCPSDIDTIVTFDNGGVSQHPNHIATFQGALHMLRTWDARCKRPAPRLLTLNSFSWRIKFTGTIAAAGQVIAHTLSGTRDALILASPNMYFAGLRAMHAHVSQLVWFRYLYLVTSVYMHANWLHVTEAT